MRRLHLGAGTAASAAGPPIDRTDGARTKVMRARTTMGREEEPVRSCQEAGPSARLAIGDHRVADEIEWVRQCVSRERQSQGRAGEFGTDAKCKI